MLHISPVFYKLHAQFPQYWMIRMLSDQLAQSCWIRCCMPVQNFVMGTTQTRVSEKVSPLKPLLKQL